MKAGKSSLKVMFSMLCLVFLISGCAETELVSHFAKKISWLGQKESKGTYKIGNPYKVGSGWYYPEENFHLSETGIASWYGPGFHADYTANGEVFDQDELTAAHRTLQLPSLVRVTNLENGRSVVVRVNDRGPFKHGRILDVSKRAAELLGYANKGTARVKIQVLENESRILAAAAQRGEDTTRMTMADISKRTSNPVSRHTFKPVYQTAQATPFNSKTAMPAGEQPAAGGDIEYVGGGDTTPESLLTPTITVDTLEQQVLNDGDAPPSSEKKILAAPQSAPVKHDASMAAGRINKKGLFMPAQTVLKEPVKPTGLFVQAGSFGVYANAEKLAKAMVGIAPTVIEPITVQDRKLYRVKLGPIGSLKEADSILERVIQAGQRSAWLIKK